MIQQGERLQFITAGDESEFPFVQVDPGAAGQENSPPPGISLIRLDGGPFVRRVQVQVGGNPARIPRVRIPNLAAWFKYGVGITSASTLVSQWDDMSGNGRHLKQATGTNQPALQADGSILFDGVDNYMKCDAFTLNQPTTVYMLAKQITWTGGERFCDGEGSNSGSIRQTTATPRLSINAGSQVAENTNLAIDTYGVIAAVFNGASSLLQINNTTPTTGDAGAGNMGGFTLGARGVAAEFCHMQCKEVLIFNVAHDANQRSAVIRYLASVGELSI